MEHFIDKYGKKRKSKTYECKSCKTKFVGRADREQKFCGRKCSALQSKVKRISKNCDSCGKEFLRTKSRLKMSKSGFHFCSVECKDNAQSVDVGLISLDHYNGGITEYRKRALKEYGEKCQHCEYDNYVEGLHVHHIDRNRKNALLENLIVLCGTCHLLIHTNIIGVQDCLGWSTPV